MCDAPFAFLAASPRVACPCSLNPKWSIRWEDFLNVTYLARGGFGQVFSANWQGVQVCVPSSAFFLKLALNRVHVATEANRYRGHVLLVRHRCCGAQVAVKEARERPLLDLTAPAQHNVGVYGLL